VESAKSIAASKLDSTIEQEVSSWLSNTEVSISGISKGKPSFGILTVQPFYESEDLTDTVFGQFSLFGNDGRTTLNAGTGYRYMTPDEHWLFGINAFYDHEFPYDHQRMSVGLEARSSIIELNANQYFAISDDISGEDGTTERALDGQDIEIGFAIPFMPGSKIYHRQFEWDTVNGLTKIEGSATSLEISGALIPGLTLEVGSTDYKTRTDREYAKLTYTIAEQTDPTPLFAPKAYQMKSMQDQRYAKVRRENQIVKQSGGFTVTFR
jgi:Protein of unknown function (DUF3442).